MKRSAVTLVALSLLASAATFAAADPYKAREAHQKLNPVLAAERHRDNDRRDNDRGHDRRDHDRRDRNDNRHDYGRQDNGHRDHDRREWDNNRHDNDRRDWDRNRHDNDRRDNDRRDWDRNRHDYGRSYPENRGWNQYRNDWHNHPNYWDNRRHDRRDYAQYRYHYGHYSRPSGYYYRSWHRGDRLPRAWYGSSYIVYDWRPYRLYSPPYGYHWVRVGDDVLLTAIATGVVLDVIYDIWY
jgi:Ni/Co efflux regulator RcnB